MLSLSPNLLTATSVSPPPMMVAGNWKMHKTVRESVSLAQEISRRIERDDVDVMLSPTFTALWAVAEALKDSPVFLAGQNLFWEEQGAYTGEISGPMLKACGMSHVIIAHSERRQDFGENEKTAGKRLRAALKAGLSPILCVGESLAEREADQTEGVLESQLAGALAGLKRGQVLDLVVAYEPVWAIGTGKTATEEQANAAHAFIRHWLSVRFDKEVANQCRILYGGSVKPDNAAGLLHQEEIDGALVGGASLKFESFLGIIKAV